MTQRYDIVILGAGNAGFGVSAVAAQAGKRIAFVEDWDYGGTCPNRGCTPKKILVAAAHALHEIERAHVHGIDVGPPKLDWAKLIDREKVMIAAIPKAMEELAAKRGDVFKGQARFVGRNSVSVGDAVLEADHIVIATGSRPRPLPIPGAEHLITSDEVLSQRQLPSEVVFIGGGVIAMEFSHVYARAGARVTILEALPQVLSGVEADAVAQVRNESERIGIAIKTAVKVTGIEPADGRLRVKFEHDGRAGHVDADRVVNGAGRIANVASLDLDTADVRHDGVRVEVDRTLRSVSNPSVWVCGDALVGSAQLSPVATYEGQVVGRNIVEGAGEAPDYRTVPSCVFTVPALASVGLTEAQAEAEGLNAAVTVNDMTDWISGKTHGETAAWAKVLVAEDTGQILGAHIVGHNSEDLIHLFALAMRNNIPAAQLKSAVYAFPTFAADVKSMV